MTILKSIVLCLALANVGYFLWVQGMTKSRDAEVAASTTADAEARLRMPAGARAHRRRRRGDRRRERGRTEPRATDAMAGLLTNVKRCISVGPFRDVAEAARAASTLRSGGYDPRQRVADGEVWAGVWVYLPAPATRAASDQVLAKLKAGGIEDAMEMPGPNDGSVISLGLFSEPRRAQARVAQAQSLGFNPGIADRKRTGNVYWVDIDLKPTDSVLKPSDLQGEAGRIVRLEVKGCPAAGGAQP